MTMTTSTTTVATERRFLKASNNFLSETIALLGREICDLQGHARDTKKMWHTPVLVITPTVGEPYTRVRMEQYSGRRAWVDLSGGDIEHVSKFKTPVSSNALKMVVLKNSESEFVQDVVARNVTKIELCHLLIENKEALQVAARASIEANNIRLRALAGL